MLLEDMTYLSHPSLSSSSPDENGCPTEAVLTPSRILADNAYSVDGTTLRDRHRPLRQRLHPRVRNHGRRRDKNGLLLWHHRTSLFTSVLSFSQPLQSQESVFFIGEFLSVVLCARLSDRCGHRPILIVGLFGLSISILSFGSTPHFSVIVTSRFFQGSFNGSLRIAKTVLNEVTDEGSRARVFRAIPLIWTFGAAVGCVYCLGFHAARVLVLTKIWFRPFTGGMLSRPAQRFSRLFATADFFVRNPYFLPCVVASFVAFVVFMVNVIGLREVRHPPEFLFHIAHVRLDLASQIIQRRYPRKVHRYRSTTSG